MNTGRDSKRMWNPSPTTYLSASISKTWSKTDDPSMISWQRPSCWSKRVAICPSSMTNYWETLLCSALILTLCERNVLLKEVTSHPRKPEKSLVLTKLPGYSCKQWQTKQIKYKSTHYKEPKAMQKPNKEARETTKPENKETTSNYASDVAMIPIQATKSVQLVVLNATVATNGVVSAKFARKETKYTKYSTIQPVTKKITLTWPMMVCS